MLSGEWARLEGCTDRGEMTPSGPKKPAGRCPLFFLLAVCFDVVGLTLVLTGIFASIELNGRSFGDLLIYSGGIMLFFSLLWWLAWYSFNLEVSIEDLLKDPPVSPKKRNLVQLARKVSERFSKRSRRKAGSLPIGLPSMPNLQSNLSPPTAFLNNCYSSPVNTPSPAGGALELRAISSLVVDRLV